MPTTTKYLAVISAFDFPASSPSSLIANQFEYLVRLGASVILIYYDVNTQSLPIQDEPGGGIDF
jgi:hypothetical protein